MPPITGTSEAFPVFGDIRRESTVDVCEAVGCEFRVLYQARVEVDDTPTLIKVRQMPDGPLLRFRRSDGRSIGQDPVRWVRRRQEPTRELPPRLFEYAQPTWIAPSSTAPRRYLSDDSDQARVELLVEPGGNGDWYLSIVREGHKLDRLAPIREEILSPPAAVRITTSGARRGRARVAAAVAALWTALGQEAGEDLALPDGPAQ